MRKRGNATWYECEKMANKKVENIVPEDSCVRSCSCDAMTKRPHMWRPRPFLLVFYCPFDDMSLGRCFPERCVPTKTIDSATAAPVDSVLLNLVWSLVVILLHSVPAAPCPYWVHFLLYREYIWGDTVHGTYCIVQGTKNPLKKLRAVHSRMLRHVLNGNGPYIER